MYNIDNFYFLTLKNNFKEYKPIKINKLNRLKIKFNKTEKDKNKSKNKSSKKYKLVFLIFKPNKYVIIFQINMVKYVQDYKLLLLIESLNLHNNNYNNLLKCKQELKKLLSIFKKLVN